MRPCSNTIFKGLILCPNLVSFRFVVGSSISFLSTRMEPYRIEFFGDEIDRINCFDIETQLSTKSLQAVDVVAHLEHKLQSEERQPLWSFLHESTTYLLPRISDICSVLDKLYEKSIEAHADLESPLAHAKPQDLFVRGHDFRKSTCQSNHRPFWRKKNVKPHCF